MQGLQGDLQEVQQDRTLRGLLQVKGGGPHTEFYGGYRKFLPTVRDQERRLLHEGEKTVEFLGFTVTSDSVRPSDKFLRAIKDFPRPRDITGSRSWFLAGQPGERCPVTVRHHAPLPQLTEAQLRLSVDPGPARLV